MNVLMKFIFWETNGAVDAISVYTILNNLCSFRLAIWFIGILLGILV